MTSSDYIRPWRAKHWSTRTVWASGFLLYAVSFAILSSRNTGEAGVNGYLLAALAAGGVLAAMSQLPTAWLPLIHEIAKAAIAITGGFLTVVLALRVEHTQNDSLARQFGGLSMVLMLMWLARVLLIRARIEYFGSMTAERAMDMTECLHRHLVKRAVCKHKVSSGSINSKWPRPVSKIRLQR